MKPVNETTLDELEETAVVSAKAIRAYLVYQGENPTYERKARVAAAAISSFARTRASETNRMGIELMTHKLMIVNSNEPPNVDRHLPDQITKRVTA